MSTYHFPYQWKKSNTAKVNPLLDALIRKDFKSADELMHQGASLKDIDERTFQRSLYEFLKDDETIRFLINHKFNRFYFSQDMYCVDENNYMWGLVGRAYFINKNVIELLFSAGFDIFSSRKYIVYDKNIEGEEQLLWLYCLIYQFDKKMIDLSLSYGLEKEDILMYVDNSNILPNKAYDYIKSNPKIEWKGYALNRKWEKEPDKPQMPHIGLFTSKKKAERIQRQYEEELQEYENKLKAQQSFVNNISDEEWKLIQRDKEISALVPGALKEIAEKMGKNKR